MTSPLPVYLFFKPWNIEYLMSVTASTKCRGRTCKEKCCQKRTTTDHKCWIHGVKDHKLRVLPSTTGHGKGLYAQASLSQPVKPVRLPPNERRAQEVVFKPDQLIGKYSGKIMTKAEVERKYPGEDDGPYLFRISDQGRGRFVDAAKSTSCLVRYVNSSHGTGRRPNVYAIEPPNPLRDKYVEFRCGRHPIKHGDELLVNYNPNGHGLYAKV